MCRHGCIPISNIKILGFHKSFYKKLVQVFVLEVFSQSKNLTFGTSEYYKKNQIISKKL